MYCLVVKGFLPAVCLVPVRALRSQLSCSACLSDSVCCRCHALVQSQVQSKNPQRWTAIAAALYNTHRYYKQFLTLMQKAIADGLAELEKQLEVRA